MDVTWRNVGNNSIAGNSLTKNSGGSGWNGNAFSVQSVSNNGYMQTTALEITTARMVGLSASDITSDWTSIQFAFFLNSGGIYDIRQSGATIPGGSYAANDVFKIANENNVINNNNKQQILIQ